MKGMNQLRKESKAPGPAKMYPLSTKCRVCRFKAWRIFGPSVRHLTNRAAYRCSHGHISLREPRIVGVPKKAA